MESTLSPDKQQSESISVLREFIRSNPEARELKRALAVKMAFEEYPYWEIADLLEVTKSFVSYWSRQFLERGIAGLKLGYRGVQSYLKPEERQAVIDWLRASNEWDFDELVTYIDDKYGVVYQSKQSYYDLFSDAGISWKKSQNMNPKSNPSLVQKKAEQLQGFMGLLVKVTCVGEIPVGMFGDALIRGLKSR